MISEIRPIELDDVAKCVDFGLESFRPVFASFNEHYGEDLFNALRPNWEHAQSAYIEEACTDDVKETWVSVVDGVAIGFVVLVTNTDTALGEIELLAVNPDHQGRGVGTALNDFAVNRLRDVGMEFAIVATGTDPGHVPARRSYDKAGFTPMSIQPQLLVRRL
jgi:ribosomal protein S18 acetylase RimI-like enzyme